jgi:small-conductance mechanosensitive channel
MSNSKPLSFRGVVIPINIDTQQQRVQWALERFRNDNPITTKEFVFELWVTRFGDSIFKLRQKGWVINEEKSKESSGSNYKLVNKPDEELRLL